MEAVNKVYYTSQELIVEPRHLEFNLQPSATATPACMGPLNILTVSMDRSEYSVRSACRASVA